MNNATGPDSNRLDILNKESDREWSRKASLEQRGITVITTSGVLVTLVFGFVSAVTKGHRFGNFGTSEKALLFVALGFFVAAAVFGLLTNIPGRFGALRLADFDKNVQDPLTADHIELMTLAIESVRKVNRTKANQLVFAFVCQIVALIILGFTVTVVLT